MYAFQVHDSASANEIMFSVFKASLLVYVNRRKEMYLLSRNIE